MKRFGGLLPSAPGGLEKHCCCCSRHHLKTETCPSRPCLSLQDFTVSMWLTLLCTEHNPPRWTLGGTLGASQASGAGGFDVCDLVQNEKTLITWHGLIIYTSLVSYSVPSRLQQPQHFSGTLLSCTSSILNTLVRICSYAQNDTVNVLNEFPTLGWHCVGKAAGLCFYFTALQRQISVFGVYVSWRSKARNAV